MGPLELTIMEMLWERGEASVHDVLGWIDRPLAYNTVMTTLHRLHRKGLLRRNKKARAHFYSPRFSRVEWQQKRAEDFVSSFFSESRPSAELLVSCLLDAVGERDTTLLDHLENLVKTKRLELQKDGD